MKQSSAPWWIWRSVQTRLKKWTAALLQGRRYTIVLVPKGTGRCTSNQIEANPEMFDSEPVEIQFRATQGLLAHEVGHALFTDAWPEARDSLLCEMVNMLEDERIERAMGIKYPGISPAFQTLGDLTYGSADVSSLPPTQSVYRACLLWRWAHTRGGVEGMYRLLGVKHRSRKGKPVCDLWQRVEPLVESAWAADDTDQVIKLAREILEILDLPESAPALRLGLVSLDGVPKSRPDAPLPFPAGPDEATPGLGCPPESYPEDDDGDGRQTSPAPYIDLEDSALPLARRLIEELKLPDPSIKPWPAEYGGRYSFRQELRTPETPFMRRSEPGKKANMAIYALVDRSGSMNHRSSHVRLSVMMLHLACVELGLPIGIAYFGGRNRDNALEEVASLKGSGEFTKSLVAGYKGETNAEYLNRGLKHARAELCGLQGHFRVLVVLHDGHPVAEWKENGKLVRDEEASKETLSSFERQGIPVIGIYIGPQEQEDLDRMQTFFPRLVCCQPEDLPNKLGSLLRSLA